MLDKHFLYGVLAGFVITYAYHHFVKPLPGAKNG
jgi:hypothetical protein